MFVDEAKISIEAGCGGNGCVSFRRARFRPKGGPDGGDGGKGGNVVFEAKANVKSLYHISLGNVYKAANGQDGSSARKQGSMGKDCLMEVPVGTVIRDQETREALADLNEAGKTFVAAKGGEAGQGNCAFASSTNQVPTESEPGEPGESRKIYLEVMLMADVGLVGLPNAGKSTLLCTLSRAKSKIGAYPFTTIAPHLGVLQLTEEKSAVLADIPGIIAGAHEGKGMGSTFLRHVERTGTLVHLVDASTETVEEMFENYKIINRELTLHSDTLAEKRQLIVLTKIDLLTTEDAQERHAFMERETGAAAIAISAAAHQGLDKLRDALRDFLNPVEEENF